MISALCNKLVSRRETDFETLATQVSDYASVGRELIVQRVLIFSAAIILQAAYVDLYLAAVCAALITCAEIYDFVTFRRAKDLDPENHTEIRNLHRRIIVGTVYGASVIGFFAISISFMHAGMNYFMPLFFLLAAAIFAAMNNNQFATVLTIRLVIYGAAFLFIPIWDLIQTGAGIADASWLNFFTSLFVLYFIIDCSLTALKYYRTSKEHLRQLKIENRKAKAALVAKTEFLSTVSHELRTPLTSIKASLDMTMAGAFGALPEKSEDVLKIAQRNAGRLSHLINELLDLQKMEIGKMQFDFKPVQVAALLIDAVTDNRSFAEDLGVNLIMKPVDTDYMVRGDRIRLEQTITNLLSNAAKFSPSGSDVYLSAYIFNGKLRIDVRDQGVGIDEENRKHIFESFSQIDASDRRKVGGTGLGLNISKRIVQAHGGKIDFASNPEGGTTFYVILDLLKTEGSKSVKDPRALPASETAQEFKTGA